MTDDPFAPVPERRSLYSVAQIHHVLRVEFNRAARHRYPLSCLALAVDRLDALRDRHGYETKERVLDGVVALLHKITRTSDYVGRTADDRLIAVVPHTDLAGAKILARRLVDGARATRLERLPEPFPLTLSMGLAATDGEADAFHDALLAAAEVALGEAIAAGGDRFAERVRASAGSRPAPAG
ncbi:MAG TPA: diguanylate cyclase [Planctomycetota bacterium]|jgi:diguanylate cyclase (GGDEF)-like protein|nr:diguanylate cyclase [Planctomycetota bacterium]